MRWRQIGYAIGLVAILVLHNAWARPLFHVHGSAARMMGSIQMAQSHATGFDVGVGYGIRINSHLELRPSINYLRLPLDSDWGARQISQSRFYVDVTGGTVKFWIVSLTGVLHFRNERARLMPSLLAGLNYQFVTQDTIYSVSRAGRLYPASGPFGRVYRTLGVAIGGALAYRLTSFLSVSIEPQYVIAIWKSGVTYRFFPIRFGLSIRL